MGPPRVRLSALVRVAFGAEMALVLVAAGCDGGYDLRVTFAPETLSADVSTLELAVVRSCDAQTRGEEPVGAVERVLVPHGEQPPTLYDLPAGSAGLWGRARRGSDCRVVAYGCEPVVLEDGGSGELALVLRELAGPACNGGERCEDGACIEGMDGGMLDGAVDGAPPMDGGEGDGAGPALDGGAHETLTMQCESGALTGQVRIVRSNGAAAWDAWLEADSTASNWDGTGGLPPDRVELPVSLARGGTYYLLVRLASTGLATNELHAGLSAGDMRPVYPTGADYPHDGSWVWLSGVSGDRAPLTFPDLEPGDHTVIIGNGEVGARCDALVLTTDPSFEVRGRYVAHRYESSTPVVVDGNPSELASAPPIEVGVHFTGTTAVYRLMWDDEALYLGGRVTDSSVETNATSRDGPLYDDDSVELGFDLGNNDGDRRDVGDYKIFVNAAGIRRDENGEDVTWDPTYELATRTIAGGYEIELAIPWSAFGVTDPTATPWGFELVQNDRSGGTVYHGPWWNADGGDLNAPVGWGTLELDSSPP